jgi:hypothetical protein
VSCAVVLLFSVGLFIGIRNWISDYEAGYATATPAGPATVTRIDEYGRGGYRITVEWRDAVGVVRQQKFDVDRPAAHPVGSPLPIRLSADRAYPDHVSDIDETRLPEGDLVVLVLCAIAAGSAWLRRAIQWRRAARAPARRCHATVLYMYGRGGLVGIPHLSIVDGNRTYYQKVMWESWFPSIGDDLEVDARRAGRGPFVVDVPGFGRLWPAARARRRMPRFTNLVAGRPSRFRLSRVGTVVLFSSILVLLPGLSGEWYFGLAMAGYFLLFALYVGGPPIPLPWRRA